MYKKSEEYKESKEDQSYTKMMSEALRKTPKRPPTTTQCASMQATMDRDPSKDAEHWNRKLDISKAIAPHPETCERKISTDEFIMVEGLRRSSKNTLGQSEKSATTEERKEKAVHAYTYSQPTKLSDAEKQKITQLESIKELKEVPQDPKEDGYFTKLLKILFGESKADQFLKNMSYAERKEYMDKQEKK